MAYALVEANPSWHCVNDMDDPDNPAAPRPMLRQQLKAFVNTVRTIARLAMEDDDANLFRANSCKRPRLKGLGIISHVAMIKCHVAVDEDTKNEIARHILRSQGGLHPMALIMAPLFSTL